MSIKDIRRTYIVDTAVKLFLSKSISEVKIKDVAEKAGIGEATFYRYFSNHTTLIIACALHLQETAGKQYLTLIEEGNGYDMIAQFYRRFYQVFSAHEEYYRFLSEFDSYSRDGADRKEMEQYSDNMDIFHDVYVKAYKIGLADGSVREMEDIDRFYYATTHALLSLCKKLASEGNIVKQDKAIDRAEEVKTLVDVVLEYLKK